MRRYLPGDGEVTPAEAKPLTHNGGELPGPSVRRGP